MASWRRELRHRFSDNLLVRPLGFVAAGLVLAAVLLRLDQAAPELLPSWLRFSAGNARLLYATLAGALLTVAGITFWVRSASVSLAASQYSARVVAGFLEDWYQQSMMSTMLGMFVYTVAVLRSLPDPGDPGAVAVRIPHAAVLGGIVLSAFSVIVIIGAIRNAVRSMYAGALARRVTDVTIRRIQVALGPVEPGVSDRGRRPDLPTRRGVGVRARSSGWVQYTDDEALLAAVPPGSVVLLEVRTGLFVIQGRHVATVWPPVGSTEPVDEPAAVAAVRLGRSRLLALDVDYGIQQLVDIAVGALQSGAADVASAYEVLQHVEMVLRELGCHELPTREREGSEGRRLVRGRIFDYGDYVTMAFDRLRRSAGPFPSICAALMTTAAELAAELDGDGLEHRAGLLRRQIPLVLHTAGRVDHVPEDLERLRDRAEQLMGTSTG